MIFDSRNSQSGFTLLELLIAIVILAFISLAIFQATTNSFRLRDLLLVEGDFYNEIRLSMDVLERDLTLIYSPKMMIPPKDSATPNNPQSPNQNPFQNPGQPGVVPEQADVPVTSEFWRGLADPTGVRHS